MSSAERTVSAIFKEQQQVDGAVRRLLNEGVPRQEISVTGTKFPSETLIPKFISKKEIINGSFRQGAIFGSLFGFVLGSLSSAGVLPISFIGSSVVASSIQDVLLGTASGALVGSVSAGLGAVLASLRMPEDKATLYATRLGAGEFILMLQMPAEKIDKIQMLLENAGGKEIHTADLKTLDRTS